MAEASTNGSDRIAATRMEFIAPPDGLRIGGHTYRPGERIPARYGRDIPSGQTPHDPAWNSSHAPPNFGREVIPNIYTYGGIQSMISKTYRNPDEALRHSPTNANAMRKDLAVEECIEARKRGTLLLDYHLETEEKNDATQKQLVQDMTRIVASIPNFTEYRSSLMEALWFGRNGVQNQFGFMHRGGKRWTIINGWKPINGDKLVFRYDDGSGEYDPDQVGIRTNYLHSNFDAVAGNRKVEATEQGPVYFLERWERPLWAVHKHIIEDGLYEDVISAGRINGVGIRDRIYWTWFQKQEALAMMMELIERTGNGFTVYYYQYGNPEAKREMTQIAANHGTNNRVLIPRLVGDPSMDSNGIEVIPANTAGVDALKEVVEDVFRPQIKRYILGQTLSSESAATGLGSGVADLHMESFLQIIKYDSRKLEETITREVIEPLKRYNFPWARDIPVFFRIDTESTEPEQKLEAVLKAWQMGAKIKESDVMSLIGLSMPTEKDAYLQNPQLAAGAMGAGAAPGMPGQAGANPMAGDDDPSDGDGSQSYDPSNNEHLFGRALKAAGVDSAQAPSSPAQSQASPPTKARYKISHAPEGGATGGGKEYKGGQFTPENAAAKGKQPDAGKPMKATAGQQAREAGMLKHGFMDQPITDAERGQLWKLARASVGDPAIPQNVRGMFVTMQMLDETRHMGVATTDKIDPKAAQSIYGWMQQNAGKDVGGGHVRDLGNGKLGFSAKAGALILSPKGNGRFDATYSSMTHVVRSAGDAGGQSGDAQAFDNVREDDGYGPELGADEMQVGQGGGEPSNPGNDDRGDGYGPEIDIETIPDDDETNDAGGETTGDDSETNAPSREAGDEDDEDAEGDPSGFGPQPKTSGPTAKAKPLNKRSEIGKAIAAAAEEHAVDENDLNEAVEHVWNMHRERLESREAAKSAVRQWWGITQRDINRLENQGKDWTALKGFDTIARAAATEYPELGIGKGRVDYGEGSDKEDDGLEESLWNALKEGKVKPPSRMEVVGEAARWLAAGHGLAKKQQEELEAVPFKKRIEELLRARYEAERLDRIPGGKGDNLSIDDVSRKQLMMGIKVEMEHTSDPSIALEIALDHLAEDAEYYTKLAKVHREKYLRKCIAEMFRARYGGKKYKPAKGQGGFDFENSSPVTDNNGHVHAPKGGATVNGKDFEGGEYIPPGDIAKATEEEKQDLKGKQVEAIAESMRKAKESGGGSSTNLFGDEVREKPKPAIFENTKTRQPKMFSGMNALPGQMDLIEDLDKPADDDGGDDNPAPSSSSDKAPHLMHPSEFAKSSAIHKELRDSYFDGQTPKYPGRGSRQVPAEVTQHPLGTWRIDDDFKGNHGHDIEQLREFDPDELDVSEHMVENNEEGRRWDAERYADWIKQGHEPPPIHVVETDGGDFRVTDGHRRLAAAKMAGKKVRAWVSPSVNVPGAFTPDGKPIKTGLTHELAIQQAIENGEKVPDEILKEYPEAHKAAVRRGEPKERQTGMFDDAIEDIPAAVEA